MADDGTMTQEAAEVLADEYRRLVLARTEIPVDMLMCPREKSSMTPCLARDGKLVVVLDSFSKPICVGCEVRLMSLLDAERAKVLMSLLDAKRLKAVK